MRHHPDFTGEAAKVTYNSGPMVRVTQRWRPQLISDPDRRALLWNFEIAYPLSNSGLEMYTSFPLEWNEANDFEVNRALFHAVTIFIASRSGTDLALALT